jgi:hypothetical protein
VNPAAVASLEDGVDERRRARSAQHNEDAKEEQQQDDRRQPPSAVVTQEEPELALARPSAACSKVDFVSVRCDDWCM